MPRAYLGAYSPGASPISVFAGVGDFGAPAVALRGVNPNDYTAYPYRRDFGTGYLNQSRYTSPGGAIGGFGDAAGMNDAAVTATQGSDWEAILKQIGAITTNVVGMIQAFQQASGAQKAQIGAQIQQATGQDPYAVQRAYEQGLAARKGTPPWLVPAAIGGVIVIGGIVALLATRR